MIKTPEVAAATRRGRAPQPGSPKSKARERILATAYGLFSHQGIRAVGVDTIVARAGVARMTFYRHFPSKDDLVLAFLDRREQLWTHEWLEGEVLRRAVTPAQRLLAIFEVFDEWFQRSDSEGCSFINVLLEVAEPASPVRQATASYLAHIRRFIRGLAEDAGISQPEEFARKWHILMKGAIVAAGEGDHQSPLRAREVGVLVLEAETGK